VSTKPIQTLDSILASIDALFDDEACALFRASVDQVIKQLSSVPSVDDRNHLESRRELFSAGHGNWLEALVILVGKYAEKLTQIAISYPNLVTANPGHWVTLQLKLLLSKHLRQELTFKVLAGQANQEILARQKVGFAYFIACEIARLKGVASDPTPDRNTEHPHRYSRVAAWCMQVIDSESYLDRLASGSHGPWRAPAFVDSNLFATRSKRTTRRLSGRLTADETKRAIRRVEVRFASRFDRVLKREEDQARVAFASNGMLQLAHEAEGNKNGANILQKTTERKGTIFTSTLGQNGVAAVRPNFSNIELLNTYESISETLFNIRAAVREKDSNILVAELKKRFRGSELERAAEERHWRGFIEDFGSAPNIGEKSRGRCGPKLITPKGVALGFLVDKTGLKCSTIKKRLSQARKQQK
jgi:hypothetical protein